VSVATLNLRKGELRWGERAPLLFEQLARLGPDIIGFQEVDVRLDQGNYIRQRLNDLIWSQEDPRVYRIHHMASPRENLTVEALGIMTHLPVKEHEGFDYLIRNRVAHRLRLDIGGHGLDFYNTHFHHVQDKPGLDLRLEQAEKLTTWIADRSRGVPAVLVGDFNCIPQSAPAQTISARLTSVFERLGIDAPKTIPTPLDPRYPGHWAIDHIFASSDVHVLDARRVFDDPHADDETLSCSDHYGLTASIEIA